MKKSLPRRILIQFCAFGACFTFGGIGLILFQDRIAAACMSILLIVLIQYLSLANDDDAIERYKIHLGFPRIKAEESARFPFKSELAYAITSADTRYDTQIFCFLAIFIAFYAFSLLRYQPVLLRFAGFFGLWLLLVTVYFVTKVVLSLMAQSKWRSKILPIDSSRRKIILYSALGLVLVAGISFFFVNTYSSSYHNWVDERTYQTMQNYTATHTVKRVYMKSTEKPNAPLTISTDALAVPNDLTFVESDWKAAANGSAATASVTITFIFDDDRAISFSRRANQTFSVFFEKQNRRFLVKAPQLAAFISRENDSKPLE